VKDYRRTLPLAAIGGKSWCQDEEDGTVFWLRGGAAQGGFGDVESSRETKDESRFLCCTENDDFPRSWKLKFFVGDETQHS